MATKPEWTPPSQRGFTIRFPMEVQQVDGHTLELVVGGAGDLGLPQVTFSGLMDGWGLSDKELDKMAEKATKRLITELVKSTIKVV